MSLPKKKPPRSRDPEAICEHGWQRKACKRCRGRQVRNYGRAVQREMHQELGGTGWSPTHEEQGRGYEVETFAVKVHPEAKGGGQIPASLVKFLGTEWYRRAIGQSERSLPIGSGSKPALWAHLPGGRKVLIVDFGGGRPMKGTPDAEEAKPVGTRSPSGGRVRGRMGNTGRVQEGIEQAGHPKEPADGGPVGDITGGQR